MQEIKQINPTGFAKLVCRLFHEIEQTEFAFTDTVSGQGVYYFKCKTCNCEYMANSKSNSFRVYRKRK